MGQLGSCGAACCGGSTKAPGTPQPLHASPEQLVGVEQRGCLHVSHPLGGWAPHGPPSPPDLFHMFLRWSRGWPLQEWVDLWAWDPGYQESDSGDRMFRLPRSQLGGGQGGAPSRCLEVPPENSRGHPLQGAPPQPPAPQPQLPSHLVAKQGPARGSRLPWG